MVPEEANLPGFGAMIWENSNGLATMLWMSWIDTLKYSWNQKKTNKTTNPYAAQTTEASK